MRISRITPARLIDAQHLDPIPLKADNPDVIKSALFHCRSGFHRVATFWNDPEWR